MKLEVQGQLAWPFRQRGQVRQPEGLVQVGEALVERAGEHILLCCSYGSSPARRPQGRRRRQCLRAPCTAATAAQPSSGHCGVRRRTARAGRHSHRRSRRSSPRTLPVPPSEAQGILMSEHHCSREEAFVALLRLAQQHGVQLQTAAEALVEQAATSSPELTSRLVSMLRAASGRPHSRRSGWRRSAAVQRAGRRFTSSG